MEEQKNAPKRKGGKAGRTIFKLALLAGLFVYLIFAFTKFAQTDDKSICRHVYITIADSSHAGFITPEAADEILRKSGQYPVGKQMNQIDGALIEETFLRNTFIDSVACYKSPNGVVNVLIEQRLPLMRIIADNGDDYYLDEKGNLMNPQGYAADLVVATGNISRAYAKKKLVSLGLYLKDNPFWDNQIEQIQVDSKQDLFLVPRVGKHTIAFGTADSISQKFRNLYAFYEKVLPEVGWNKYSEISVEHVSQIVGRKEKKS